MRARYTARAYRDLTNIADTIAEDDPAAAGRVLAAIERVISLLVLMPAVGRCPDDHPDVRQFPVRPYPYLIVYRIQSDCIEIITIWHTARGRDALLS